MKLKELIMPTIVTAVIFGLFYGLMATLCLTNDAIRGVLQ